MKRDKIGIPLARLPESSLNMVSTLIAAKLDDPINKWKMDPVKFVASVLHWRFPQVLLAILYHILDCVRNKRNIRIVLIGPRGGGKTVILSIVEYLLSLLYNYDFLNLAGSLSQAKIIHAYQQEFYKKTDFKNVKNDSIFQTVFTTGAWISCVASSSTQVRGKHPGGSNLRMGNTSGKDSRYKNKDDIDFDQLVPYWDDVQVPEPGKVDDSGRRGTRGGGLVIDEECEADPEVVRDALPMVNSAFPSVIIRASTFHELNGTFQDIVDHAEERGYTLFKWDIFDVMMACDRDCSTCFDEFAKDSVQDVVDPDTGQVVTQILKKAYCGGKAKFNVNGFIRPEEIFNLWIECGQDKEWFEVEFMGRRPSARETKLAPYVESIFVDEDITIEKDCPVSGGIDWGMQAGHKIYIAAPTGVGGPKYLIVTQSLAGKPCDIVCDEVEKQDLKRFEKCVIYTDGENVYNNDRLHLVNHPDGSPLKVFPTNFAQNKRALLFPNLLSHVQNEMFLIPRSVNGARFPERTIRNLKRKMKKYRLEPRGMRKMEGMDEIDGIMLALSHWGNAKRKTGTYGKMPEILTGGRAITNFGGL